MSLAKTATKIGKLSTIYLVGSFLPQVVKILVLPVFTDYMSKEQMGIFNLAGRVGTPLSVLIQLGALAGLKSWFFRTDAASRPQLVRTMQIGQFGVNFTAMMILALIGLGCVEYILPGLPFTWTTLYILWLLILADALGDASTKLATLVMRLSEHATKSVTLSFVWYLLQTALGLAIVVVLARQDMREWQGFGRQAGATIGSLIWSVIAACIVWKYGAAKFDASMFKKTLRTGVTFVPHQLSDGLMLTANSWMVNGFFSTAALGVYGIAVSFAQLIQIPLLNFGDAAFPTLSRLMRENTPESRRQQARIYTLTLLLIIVAILAMQLLSTIAIRVLTNPAFHEAALVVPILIFAWLFQAFYQIASQPVFFFGGGLWLSLATGVSIIVSAAAGVFLIPEYGMYGAAWSMVAGFVAKLLVTIAATTYLHPLPWEIWKLTRALACAALVAWVDWRFLEGWLVVVKDIETPGSFFERVEWINLTVMVGVKLLLLTAIAPLLWIAGVVTGREFKLFADAVRSKLNAWLGR